MKKIKTALISVSDKSNLKPLLEVLRKSKIKILSSGGTYKIIKKLKFNCLEVSEFTGSREILGGRVKTLHPKIHAGILNQRKNKKHVEDIKKNSFENIDLVIVNFYPFLKTLELTKNHNTIVENIDIGGPAMVRAAAKNYNDVTVITSVEQYPELIKELKNNRGSTSLNFRKDMSRIAFTETAYYDSLISNYFNKISNIKFPQRKIFSGNLIERLRYGENPHQKGRFIGNIEDYIKQLHGKDISYNNLLDIDASIALLKDLQTDNPVFLIHKHNNPCGVAIRSSILEAYEDALACDNVSAFGGVLCSNKIINKDCANRIDKLFFEILIAPDFDEKALSILKSKKNRILIKLNKFPMRTVLRKSCLNGFLEQDIDDKIENFQDFRVVTNNPPNEENSNDLVLASIIAKHTKSNCIVIVKNQQLIGSGMGQVSRIDALNQAIDKSKKFGFELKGSNLASDAFFPFSDCVEIAFKNGIDSIVQPGGSVRDQDSIDFCNENEMSMVFSGIRHFRH